MKIENEAIISNEVITEHHVREAAIKLGDGNHVVLVDAEEAGVTVKLPKVASNVNRFVTVYARLIGSGYSVIISTYARDNIYDSTGEVDSITLSTTDGGVVLFCDGLAWFDISSNT